MKFYDKNYTNNYEELITYYPRFYRDVFEMVEILKAHGRLADGLEASIEQTYLNSFIDYADGGTVTKMETFLGLTYDSHRSLVDRRKMIKALLLGMGHIGQKEIKDIISVFTDGDIEVQLIGGVIQITVTRGSCEDFNLYDCNLILDNKVPAHLSLDMVDSLLPVSATSDNRFILQNLNIETAIQNRRIGNSDVQLKCTAIKGLSARQPFGVSGSVIMDSHGTLNGGFTLNGTKSLNQIYSKEDL